MLKHSQKLLLIGYMGAGKSFFGKILAEKFSVPFTDLDVLIEKREGISIRQIFKEKGEDYFRNLEYLTLKNTLKSNKQGIIALGGGTPCFSENIKLISNSEDSYCIYLNSPIDILTETLFLEKKQRPILNPYKTKKEIENFIKKHLAERESLYNRVANEVFLIKGKDFESSAKELISMTRNLFN